DVVAPASADIRIGDVVQAQSVDKRVVVRKVERLTAVAPRSDLHLAHRVAGVRAAALERATGGARGNRLRRVVAKRQLDAGQRVGRSYNDGRILILHGNMRDLRGRVRGLARGRGP